MNEGLCMPKNFACKTTALKPGQHRISANDPVGCGKVLLQQAYRTASDAETLPHNAYALFGKHADAHIAQRHHRACAYLGCFAQLKLAVD